MLRFFLLFAPALAWVPTTSPYYKSTTTRHSIPDSSDEGDVAFPDTLNPCWQSLLDDDCNMSTMYASSFVAGKWIKSMPCGEGIEDCDMPAALMTPDTYPKSGVTATDVMDFLHLKRATSINSNKKP